MHIRHLKIMFVLVTSLMALVYVTQNVANADAAHQSIMYVMSGADHEAYPDSFGPTFSNPMFGWVAVAIIFSLEYATGLVLMKGAWDMWQARSVDAVAFRESMKWAQIGCGFGVFVWFGLFGVIGAAFFQMWQTAIGDASMDGAFQLFISCAITLLFLNQSEH
jgi:predicted small integral membrane protein